MATTESTTEIRPDTGKIVGRQHSEHEGPGPQIMAADTPGQSHPYICVFNTLWR